jgi:lysophospholipid acyltransferase
VNKVKNFLASWNISVQSWLKCYVFMRMLENNKRGGAAKASLVTFMVSGIWHGFYPGFAAFFFGAFLMDYHNKVTTPVVGPLFKGWCPDIIQDIGIVVFYYISLSYYGVAFWLLNFEDFHKVYCDMYYFGHIIIIATLIPCMLLQPKKQSSRAPSTSAADVKKTN